jgi:hypothetical protein
MMGKLGVLKATKPLGVGLLIGMSTLTRFKFLGATQVSGRFIYRALMG